MDYSILKGLIIAFLIQHCTSEDVTSSIQSPSAVVLHEESPASLQEQEPAAPELVPVVAAPSLQEVQQAVQEASEKEGQGAEEVLKGLLERVVEAALGAAESTGEAKVDEPAAETVEADTEEDSQTDAIEKVVVVEDTDVEQEPVDALADGTVVVESNSETLITDINEKESNEEVTDKIDDNMELTSDIPEEKESAAEMVVGGEPAQETIEGSDLSPGRENVELESVIQKTEEVIDIAQTIAEEALEQAIDSNKLQDNEMSRTGDVEGNLVVQEVDSEQVQAVESVEMGDGETVIEGGSIVPKVTDGSEAAEEEAAPEAANSSKDEDHELQQASDGVSQDSAAGVVEEGLLQGTDHLPETPPPSPSLNGAEIGESTPGAERSSDDNKIISPTDDQPPAQPTLDNAVKEVLILPPQTEGEQSGKANELVEDLTNNRETNELGLEAWKIGAICAAVLLLLETAVIIAYILRNRNKNSSSRQRVSEEGSVEPEGTTGADYSDDTLPAGNGDAQQNALLDPSKVAATLLQNKDQQEAEQVIPMSELPPSSAEDTPNNTAAPEPSQDRRTSAL